jgi:CRISPR-associated DxTHG motif protein
MARVFLSFLGTNDYVPCVYYLNDPPAMEKRRAVRFVQQDTIGWFCRDWGASDRILIFTTPDAVRKNWMDDGHNEKSGLPKKCHGLQTCLGEMGLAAPYRNEEIPEGRNEGEIWGIFTKVYDAINEGDEIYFDITHAFRSIPMLAVVVLNYAKVLKKIRLGGIFYGAIEAIGSLENVRNLPETERLAPVLDLTPFNQLLDWSTAIDRFIETGSAGMVQRLADESVAPVIKSTKGKDRAAVALKRIGRGLDDFSRILATCRGLKISDAASRLKNKTETVEGTELLPPFVPLFDMIKKTMEPFSGDPVADGIKAVEWCRDHNLSQQGFTILNELAISHILSQAGQDPHKIDYRTVASQALTISQRNLTNQKSEWAPEARENENLTLRIIKYVQGRTSLVELMSQLREARNDLNHAGFRKNPMDESKFEKRLDDLLKVFINQVKS